MRTRSYWTGWSLRSSRSYPACGERKLERLFGTGAGVIFKGSGFYETDYKRAGESRPSETEKPSESKKSDTSAKSGADKKD